jgi:hypothetical protein
LASFNRAKKSGICTRVTGFQPFGTGALAETLRTQLAENNVICAETFRDVLAEFANDSDPGERLAQVVSEM